MRGNAIFFKAMRGGAAAKVIDGILLNDVSYGKTSRHVARSTPNDRVNRQSMK